MTCAIKRQVYARDRRLALLQPQQDGCRCAATVRTFAGCPRRACASPTPRTFRPVVAKTSQKPWLGTLQIPGFCIAPFIILRCNENCVVDQQVSAGPWRRPACRQRAQSLNSPPPNKYAANDVTPDFPCFGRRSTRKAMLDQRNTPALAWHAPCDLSPAERDRARLCGRQPGEKTMLNMNRAVFAQPQASAWHCFVVSRCKSADLERLTHGKPTRARTIGPTFRHHCYIA